MKTSISAAELGARRLVARAALVLAALALLPMDAEAQERRACRATGYFMFTFDEYADGSVVTRTARINILQSDMEVIANAAGQTWSSVTQAKRWACDQAAICFVMQAAGIRNCRDGVGNADYELVRMPENVDAWRRDVACGHARAGSIPGVRRTDSNTVKLLSTKIVATASRDGITRNADRTVDEGEHVCWSPSDTPPARPGTKPTPGPRKPEPSRTDGRFQPSRTDSSHNPSRTDSSHAPSRTNSPSPIANMALTVTPAEHRGKCPTTVTMQARVQLREPAEVRWWVTGEDGYESPKYVRNFTKPDANVIWRRQIDPKPTTGGLTQKPGAKPSALIHRGYFQLHFETVSDTRAIPLGSSEKAEFTLACETQN